MPQNMACYFDGNAGLTIEGVASLLPNPARTGLFAFAYQSTLPDTGTDDSFYPIVGWKSQPWIADPPINQFTARCRILIDCHYERGGVYFSFGPKSGDWALGLPWGNLILNNTWHHFLCAYDLGVANGRGVAYHDTTQVFDGVLDASLNGYIYTSEAPDVAASRIDVGRHIGTNPFETSGVRKWIGGLAEVYTFLDSSFDFIGAISTLAARNKFWKDGIIQNFGGMGSGPLNLSGAPAPRLYCSGPPELFKSGHAYRSGGLSLGITTVASPITVNGTLIESTSDPFSDTLIA